MMISVAELGKGGGLLEKPTIEKTTPGRESEFDVRYKTLFLLMFVTYKQLKISMH